MKRLLCFLFLFFLFHSGYCQDPKGKEYLLKMLDAIEKVNTAGYTLHMHERVGDKFRDSEFKVKLNVRPYKLYALSVYPHNGAEALLVAGANNQKILINPNRFPYLNLSLSPFSSILRKNHHYTLNDVGFSYIEKILKGYLKRDGDEFYKILRFYENIDFNSKQYYMLEMDYPVYSITNYTVKAGETISSIAEHLLVNDYKILSLNPQIEGYDGVKAGNVIQVPNAFARKIVLYLDKTTLLPMVQNVYDEKGLFGRYDIRDFILNPSFGPDEFTAGYNGYRF
jgi:outer membrane lipoprotein-sorting protein